MSKQAKSPKIVKVFNKKAGVTYLYEDVAYWDPEIKQGRHKRKCIGKIDRDGNTVYNDYYLSRQNSSSSSASDEPGIVSNTTLLGQNLLLDSTITHIGLTSVLVKSLGHEDASSVIQLAKYSVCTGKPLSYAESWLDERGFEGSLLCSQRISELLQRLNKDVQNTFFSQWIEKNREKNHLLFDISSVSSYAKNNTYVEWGYNRDKEKVPQINVALLSSYVSRLPLWYCELPGSMNDSVVLQQALGHLKKLEIPSSVIIGDRAFCSAENIAHLCENGHKFLIPMTSNVKWVRELIEKHRHEIQRPFTLMPTDESNSIIYGLKKIRKTEQGRMWAHIYFDATRRERDIASLMIKLNQCKDELEADEPVKNHTSYYRRYFEVKETPKRGRRVILKEDEVQAFIEGQSGFWVLYSNAEKDPAAALSAYRQRNNIELLFDDMKNLVDCNRLRVHSEQVMLGRLFVNFVALIILTSLKERIKQIPGKDRKYWNYREFLDKVNTYSKVHYRGKYKDVYTVPTKAQRLIFDLFNIEYFWKGKLINETDFDPFATDMVMA
jgi:transposase